MGNFIFNDHPVSSRIDQAINTRYKLPAKLKKLCKLSTAAGVMTSALSLLHAEQVEETKESICMKTMTMEKMYDDYDLSKWSLFSGGFINFGYWEKIKKDQPISESQRTESEKNLYRHVAKKIGISKEDKVLEVACGLGLGSSLILSEFSPTEIKAIDISNTQIERAKTLNQKIIKKSKKLDFQIGKAEKIPFQDQSFEKVFSIEAVQHFSSVESFIKESYRILKPKGKIAVATFFATDKDAQKKASLLIKTVNDGIDHLIPISDVRKMLEDAGFKNIKIESIGKNVWQGFDKWVSQQSEFKDTWNRNWYTAYQDNLVDYYEITAEKLDLK